MTLELMTLTPELQAMGIDLAQRAGRQAQLVEMARQRLSTYSLAYSRDERDHLDTLRRAARVVRAAIPTDEPIDGVYPDPGVPERLTLIGVDGSQIEPDRHGVAFFHLVNVGGLLYRHGSGEAPEAYSQPALAYTEDEIYEDGRAVSGNLLDVRRDLAEITQMATLCDAEARRLSASPKPAPIVGLVDGTLLLWVLDDRSETRMRTKVAAYLEQLDRIRRSGAALSAFTSRPRHTEVTRLLHLMSMGGDAVRAGREPNPLEHVPDRAVFETLPPGARSAVFLSPSPINLDHYEPAGHAVHFFYVNVADHTREPVVARVEAPSWVAFDRERLGIVHGAIVSQARITGDYPYVLARADELAFISGQERDLLSEMVATALIRAGMRPSLSPKANQKAQTRGRRR